MTDWLAFAGVLQAKSGSLLATTSPPNFPGLVPSSRCKFGSGAVAIVHGERSLKRLRLDGKRPRLMFENADMPLFELPEIAEIEIWGVVVCNIHWLRRQPGRGVQ